MRSAWLVAVVAASGCHGGPVHHAADPGPHARAAAVPSDAGPVDAGPPPDPRPWLKGSTHVHTLYSGDSRTPLAEVVGWYRDHGYDFIVVTDHNRVTVEPTEGPLLVLPGIELTLNSNTCEPPPPEPEGKCRIHVNSLFVTSYPETAAGTRPDPIEWSAHYSGPRVDLYQAALDESGKLGGLAQINHPNWHWGMTGDLLAELGRRGFGLVEIENTAFSTWNQGTAVYPATTAVWDEALSRGVILWGVASDDAHDYLPRVAGAEGPYYPAGGGFIMVHAERRADAIRQAIARGEFYASTGVLLAKGEVTGGKLEVLVSDASPGNHRIRFIGQGGALLSEVSGRSASYPLAHAPRGYLRAEVLAADGTGAWLQPIVLAK